MLRSIRDGDIRTIQNTFQPYDSNEVIVHPFDHHKQSILVDQILEGLSNGKKIVSMVTSSNLAEAI